MCKFGMNGHCIGNCETCEDKSNLIVPLVLEAYGRGSKQKWGYSWRYTRQLVFYRDKKRCRMCKRLLKLTDKDWEVHHIIRREYKGTNHPRNLILLCNNCHKTLQSRKLDEKFKKQNEIKEMEKWWSEWLNQ